MRDKLWEAFGLSMQDKCSYIIYLKKKRLKKALTHLAGMAHLRMFSGGIPAKSSEILPR